MEEIRFEETGERLNLERSDKFMIMRDGEIIASITYGDLLKVLDRDLMTTRGVSAVKGH